MMIILMIYMKKRRNKFLRSKINFHNLKGLFKRQGYQINWKEIEKQSLDQTINTLSMASPFSLEEKASFVRK